MISEWRVRSFKSACREAKIRLPGITVVVGANSSGKSAILQSMLLVAQSVADRVPGRQVVVNGRWAKLGDYSEIHSSGAADPISIALTIDVESLLAIASTSTLIAGLGHLAFHAKGVKKMDYSVVIDKGKEDGVKGLLLPRIVECRFRIDGEDAKASELHIVASTSSSDERLEKLLAKTPDAGDYRNLAAALEYEIRKARNVIDADNQAAGAPELVGAVLGGWTPTAYVYRYDQTRDDAKKAVAALFGATNDPLRGSERLQELLSKIEPEVIAKVIGQLRSLMQGRPEMEPLFRHVLSGEASIGNLKQLVPILQFLVPDLAARAKIASALEESIIGASRPSVALGRLRPRAAASAILDAQFGKLFRYLGPLREEPRSLYPVAMGADSEDVGVRGEYTSSVLDLHKRAAVSFVGPDVFLRDGYRSKPGLAELSTAVQDWLSYLGVVERIETSDLAGGIGHRVRVAPAAGDAEVRSLVHVGVGVSQVLPVLVMCLLAPPGSVLVMEQPELHLHPAVQSRLADFFIAQMLASKKFVVETHSEYMISRLRLRCVEAEGEGLSAKTVVYCAEQAPDGEGAGYREAAISRFGAIAEWPRGFFDILPQESSTIMEEALKKRLHEKGGRGE